MKSVCYSAPRCYILGNSLELDLLLSGSSNTLEDLSGGNDDDLTW